MIKSIIKRAFSFGMRVVPPSLFSVKSLMESQTAKCNLTSFSAKPNGLPFANNEIVEPTHDLQIIIPAYNAELWLEDCMESILSQKTKYSYKIVLIDDGSTDSTSTIADRYANDERVLVIKQENKGCSEARNSGLRVLFGKYIMFVDSDDMLYQGAIEALLSAAFAYDSDIVEGGAFYFENRRSRVYFSHSKTKLISNAIGVLHGQPWAKVYKAKCFEHIVFPEGFWYEDSILSFLVYPQCERICVINSFTYLYRRNTQGITNTSRGKKKSLDSYWITEMLMEHSKSVWENKNSAFLEKYLRQVVLNQKRIRSLPEYIQESVFILSADLLMQYFSEDIILENMQDKRVYALYKKDLGMYKQYCVCH